MPHQVVAEWIHGVHRIPFATTQARGGQLYACGGYDVTADAIANGTHSLVQMMAAVCRREFATYDSHHNHIGQAGRALSEAIERGLDGALHAQP